MSKEDAKPKLPRLKIKADLEAESICNIEEARNKINFGPEFLVLIDGRLIHSHRELVELVSQPEYKNRDLIEVMVLPFVEGG